MAAAAAACRGCGLCAARRRGVPRAARARAQCRMRRPLDHVGWMSPRFLRHRAWPSSRSQPLASSCAIRAVECGCHGPPPCPTVLGMRTGPLVLATAVMLALAGCVPSDSPATSEPSASLTPVFASDAEALAAAEAAYAAYQAAVDTSLQTVANVGLDSVATGDALKSALGSVGALQKAGRHQSGESLVKQVKSADMSTLTVAGRDRDPAQIYACLDVSKVIILDSTGTAISEAGRQTVFPTLVSVLWASGKRKLLVSEESVWDGADFCV